MKVSRPVSVSRPIFSGLGLGLEHIFVVLVLVSRCCGLGLVRSKLVSRPACFLIHHANLGCFLKHVLLLPLSDAIDSGLTRDCEVRKLFRVAT